MKAFFVLPGQALVDLREELEIIENEEAGGTLERFGVRAGLGLVRTLGVECEDVEGLRELLPQLWAETGLGRMELEEVSEGRIAVSFHESIEASHERRCDFARGYLTGIVSSLTGRRYRGEEVSCISAGQPMCRHVLVPVEEPPPESPVGVEEGRRYDLETGYSYLIKTPDPSPAFEILTDYLRHGFKGLCISREYPEKLRERYDLTNCSMLWLSYDRDLDYAREPTNIPLIYSEAKAFIDSDERRVVLISGLEYLISQSTFIKVLKFVQLLNENVAVRDSLLLLPVSPETLEEKEVKLLERELRVFTPG